MGSHIYCDKDGILINQGGFVEGRLFNVEVPRSNAGAEPAFEEQTIDNRSLLGALSWLATQSRPDIQVHVALGQQLQKGPCVDDVRFSNRTVGKALEHREEGVRLRPISLDRGIFMVFHDAAWANAEGEDAEEGFTLTREEIEAGTIKELYGGGRQRKATKEASKVASQLGHLVMFFDEEILRGKVARGSLLEWRSQSCKRVCRSTFGAETMSAAEGLEGGQYVRALLGTLVTGKLVTHHEARGRWPIVCMTDCKSLHEHIHRTGVARIPSDRRLAIDLAALKQELQLEQWGRKLPMQWVPTGLQLADPMTKPKKTATLWEWMRNGIGFPFKEDLFQPPKRG